jgi:hypothetical protein
MAVISPIAATPRVDALITRADADDIISRAILTTRGVASGAADDKSHVVRIYSEPPHVRNLA